jgi:alkylation response protein AidB-like acyl-CoA dehydrogenase
MDLTLSEEHASLRATVEDFARKGVARVIGEIYERGEFPYEIVAKMGAMGLFGLPIAEDYGAWAGTTSPSSSFGPVARIPPGRSPVRGHHVI